MPQYRVWEDEYKKPAFVSKKAEPQADVLKFFKFIRKKHKIELENLRVLDLGCGTGRNANYLAKLGNEVSGMEISDTALNIAKKRAEEENLKVNYFKQSIGETYSFADNFFDLALDVMSSNSLNEKERKIYLQETQRVLKPGGLFFVKALCKDGDKNAKYLLKNFPGVEKDVYIMKGVGLAERVFSQEDFRKIYGQFFQIIEMHTKMNYNTINGIIYKRNYIVAYLKK